MDREPDNADGAGENSARPSEADPLNYISELIRELKQMAEKSGYKTLAAILGMAQVEARIQNRDVDR